MTPEAASSFEAVITGIEAALDNNFTVKIGTNLSQNLTVLRTLADMTKPELEVFLSKGAIVSLNDADFTRLQTKIRTLFIANEAAAKEQGIT